VVILLAFLVPHQAPRPTTLKPVFFADSTRVPFELEIPIAREKPFKAMLSCQQPLIDLLGEFTIVQRKKDLLVQNDSMLRALKARGNGRPSVLELPFEDRTIAVLFYTKQGEWFAAPAAMVSASTSLGVLEILDVDLDGAFDGKMDFLAWRRGRLHLQGVAPLVFSETGLHSFALAQVGKKLQVELSAAQYPLGVAPEASAAWFVANELRNGIGLEPVQMDVKRTAAAVAHCHYLQSNGEGGSGSLNVHEELSHLPGYTEEGKNAARGNVSWGSGGHDLGNQPVHEFATLFHRNEFLFPSQTMGAGAEGEYGVVWLEDAQFDTARWLQETGMESSWVMTPGPGQTRVPQRALRDSPVPASVPNFYSHDRGYPVSVSCSYTYSQLKQVSLRLFDSDGEEMEGFAITMSDAGFTSQGFSADYLFAAKSALASKSIYRAEFRAFLESEERQLSFSWTFSTGK